MLGIGVVLALGVQLVVQRLQVKGHSRSANGAALVSYSNKGWWGIKHLQKLWQVMLLLQRKGCVTACSQKLCPECLLVAAREICSWKELATCRSDSSKGRESRSFDVHFLELGSYRDKWAGQNRWDVPPSQLVPGSFLLKMGWAHRANSQACGLHSDYCCSLGISRG